MAHMNTPAESAPTISPGEHVTLVGEGIALRPFENSDADVLVALAADPLIRLWNPISASDRDEAVASIERWRDWETHATWAIADPGSGQVLGRISLFHLDAANSAGEFGYFVAPSARGQGVGGRALKLAASYGFHKLGLERLELFHAIENSNSCKVAEKAGFLKEGHLRSSYRYADGILHDEHLHARLRSD
jgi:RimJ/RimL family protein N-acetyltransferase